MSAATTTTTTTTGSATTAAGRLAALGKAELTLLGRSKGMLVTAIVIPLVLPLSVQQTLKGDMLEKAGLTMGTALLTAGIGFAMLFAVYSALVNIYVARREELVLKRLRTGELRDREILAGTALPAALIGLAQCVVVAVACTALVGLEAPRAPHLAVLGVLLGTVLMVALGAVTAAFSRTAESAQVSSLPLMFVSMIGSGMTVPLEVFPDRLASVLELLPLSPAMRLVRGGWTGELSAYEALGAAATAVAWVLLAVFAVQRWFRWEPRR
ncbi:ABC transporter permease [Streptomyces sp. B-S-A8]|uniref:Transport permease protein n=1 Tax=Streptomyces solicavernae TaxID=3043614 RepID=A0ABT6RWC3_9ACTN|nr:ABC transporter permease [Streptomyces sp. B-S-A8]MDI3388723.1 ABC transporter permease [Streptomyces sp. B-S-A8]